MLKSAGANFLYSLILVVITALWCSYFNHYGMENFYHQLELPKIMPPDYVFAIVWGIIYVLLIISFNLILDLGKEKNIKIAVQLFIANMMFQILWSFVFFYQGYFLIAFSVMILLDFLAFFLIQQFYKLEKIAAYLLVPYFVWLLFATYLNWWVADLNGPSFYF